MGAQQSQKGWANKHTPFNIDRNIARSGKKSIAQVNFAAIPDGRLRFFDSLGQFTEDTVANLVILTNAFL